MKYSSYLVINVIFVLVIGVIFSYSYFFYPNDHPVSCEIKRVTGKDCPSCGMSRAYSAFVRGKIAEGLNYNRYSFYSFLFLAVQFVYRAGVMAVGILKKKEFSGKWIAVDISVTVILFILSFYKFLFVDL